MKLDTIKEKSIFKELRKKGRVSKNKYLIIYILPGEEEKQVIRAGFGISRKTGKAFQRNKTRRVLKEILRNVTIPFSINLYIIVKKTITGACFSEIKEELEKSLNYYFLNYGHKQS
ncbi:MAG: ribonuclease P protein component [Actinomycetia bacterium]|nr:ribonuclease P protein component [Actinomycetes bacterium]